MLAESYYKEPTEVDQLVFDKLVPQDHYLRRVKCLIDFERFRDKVKDCYSPDLGRTAEDPVRLIQLEFLQFHYRLSDREVIAQAQVNLAFRFFLALALDSPLPVPSLLSQFRTRLGEKRHQALFEEVVKQAREEGLVKDRLRLKDATHIIANIAVPSAIALVAQTRDRLLESARPYAPERVAQEEAEAAQIRVVTSDLKDTERLTYRVAHLREIVAWANELQKGLGPEVEGDRQRQRLEEALALAHQVLSDRDDPDKGDRVRSSVDPEARRGKHGKYYDGYLLDLSVDAGSELITALNVLPGNGQEAQDAQTLMEAEEQAHGNAVKEISIDGIGWQGKVLQQLGDPEGLGLAVYVPPPVRPGEGTYFTPDKFTLEEGGEALRCPGGEQTRRRYRDSKDSGWKFFFSHSQCEGCPLRGQCMAAPTSRGHGRTVVKNDYQKEYEAAWARSRTERYAEVRREHPKVERKLGEMVWQGGRRSRYWGRWRVKVQYLLVGMVVNIKRMVKLLLAQEVQVAYPGTAERA